ncbi:MAG: hypothetical protein LAO55_21365 [Acidobacteriia bacterium]|nr:hypothetical protein [Terriglobia bacterium]
MEFEDLQAIWDTQNDKPVFAMQDARLLLALYQQRERSRRRLFKQYFMPMYIMAPIGLVGVGFVFFAFFMKSLYIKKLARDFPMSAWDYAAFAVAAGALLAIVVPMYLERKKHERTQEIFAPSLREELDRGIAQLDFEMGLHSTPRVERFYGLMTIAVVLFGWEVGRLNGNSTSWGFVWMTMSLMIFTSWAGFITIKEFVERVMQRKHALESMRAALDEDAVVLPRK